MSCGWVPWKATGRLDGVPQTGVAVGHERTRGGPRASAGVAPRMVTRGAAGRH